MTLKPPLPLSQSLPCPLPLPLPLLLPLLLSLLPLLQPLLLPLPQLLPLVQGQVGGRQLAQLLPAEQWLPPGAAPEPGQTVVMAVAKEQVEVRGREVPGPAEMLCLHPPQPLAWVVLLLLLLLQALLLLLLPQPAHRV